MKKFSTAVPAFVLAVGLCSTFAQPAHAQAASTAAAAASPAPAKCQFLSNAPDRHPVVKGDTLWGIAGRFLEHPWCWPQVWGLNREQIRDPHWIYPGQVVVFDRATQQLRVAQTGNDSEPALPEVKLSPQARVQSLGPQPIASIPSALIDPFLSQPLIVESATLQNAPRIIAVNDGHLNTGKGDQVFVRGEIGQTNEFQVFRPARALHDPVTREVLGHEAGFLGTVRLDRAARAPNEAHRFVVTSSREEIAAGARLIPVPAVTSVNYVPRLPTAAVDARVVSMYDGLTQAGRNNIVTINRGTREGIAVGDVLQLYRLGPTMTDRGQDGQKSLVKLPDQRYGTLFVFRVFDRLSYGLVMQVTDAVRINDIVRSPE